ncbi:hypothetical protein IC575_014429 [Cucumis melo]
MAWAYLSLDLGLAHLLIGLGLEPTTLGLGPFACWVRVRPIV